VRRLNPTWNDETIYQETRRIVVAEYQHVFLSEYVPTIFGQEQIKRYSLDVTPDGEYSCRYNSTVNPGIANEFITAAFRFGHSQIPDFFL
jgi:hypothetical protein